MFDSSELKRRRHGLLSAIEKDACIILIAASECLRNGDVYYPYHQSSDFYYLTAFPEPEAVALLLPDSGEGKLILFNRAHDPLAAVWVGQRIGQDKACEEYGVDEAYSIDQLELKLPDYLASYQICYYIGQELGLDKKMVARVNTVLAKINKQSVQYSRHLTRILHAMRLIKNEAELACLRQAATISSKAHVRAMKACRPGRYEYQLEAELLYEFYQNGSRFTAYPTIVASGANACILHYTDNQTLLKDSDLVLIDAGCEYQYYASDITRTFPVNGRFNSEQKALYNIVLETQKKLISSIKSGLSWYNLQESCVYAITIGLVDLGLLKGQISDLIRKKAYKRFYMHGCSHWLGLDVHDVGGYKRDKGAWCTLAPNMVLTVEPGIYITPAKEVDEKWWNMGIRIEDDVRVTENGCEVLSKDVPKEMGDIESLMRS